MTFKELSEGRPIGFLALGPSLHELEENIELFRNKDMCWGTLNDPTPACDLLNKISASLDFYVGFAKHGKNKMAGKLKLTENKSRGNSLHEFICLCNDWGVTSTLYLFGTDGWSEDPTPLYYEPYKSCPPGGYTMHKRDTEHMNQYFTETSSGMPVINTTLTSKITCFPKMSLESVAKELPHAKT